LAGKKSCAKTHRRPGSAFEPRDRAVLDHALTRARKTRATRLAAQALPLTAACFARTRRGAVVRRAGAVTAGIRRSKKRAAYRAPYRFSLRGCSRRPPASKPNIRYGPNGLLRTRFRPSNRRTSLGPTGSCRRSTWPGVTGSRSDKPYEG
jgi:hypothetical protein